MTRFKAAFPGKRNAKNLSGEDNAPFDRGLALLQKGELAQTEAVFVEMLQTQPDHADALHLLGIIAHRTAHHQHAIALIGRAIRVNPNNAAFYNNRGVALKAAMQPDAAVASFDRAIALRPEYAEAYNNRGNALLELKKLDAALESYRRAVTIKPDAEFLFGTYLNAKMLVCDWESADECIHELTSRIQRHEKASSPFPVLAFTDSPARQRTAAALFVQAKYPSGTALGPLRKRVPGEKIRIGYYSSDFHNHATAYLTAKLFECHDKSRFELIAFSFDAGQQDEMRRRITAAFDTFLDVRMKSDEEVARLSRELGIDIAVDLKGFTEGSRTGIFAQRCAPLQVNYLGYPGSMGAEHMDYLIADKTLIPQESRRHYSEKIVYLPDCYQVNDVTRKISDKNFTRAELGLPQTGFVYCCFNNNFKILPATFDCWMRILNEVEGSLLWLLEDNPTAAGNLRKEAELRGVDAGRLIFVGRINLAEHLARQRVADLFLDTFPYNAHTTASDALWAGLPLLTCSGESFASRVAASLLRAVGLPELITRTQQEYEARAIELAKHPDKISEVRFKLERNRLTTPLFDTLLFTRHIEAAYTAMYERSCAGMPVTQIEIERFLPSR